MQESESSLKQPTYIFPEKVAASMARSSPKMQYEAQMFGTSFMMLGLVLTVTYFVTFFEFALWYKVVLVLNGLAGLLVMGVSVTTTYQQYLAFMAAMRLQAELFGQRNNYPEVSLKPNTVRLIRHTVGCLALLGGLLLAGFVFEITENKVLQYIIVFAVIPICCWGAYKSTQTEAYIKKKFNIQQIEGGKKDGIHTT